jgi:hypothetical protein
MAGACLGRALMRFQRGITDVRLASFRFVG